MKSKSKVLLSLHVKMHLKEDCIRMAAKQNLLIWLGLTTVVLTLSVAFLSLPLLSNPSLDFLDQTHC